MTRPGKLVLADGTSFEGQCIGAVRTIDNPVVGEVVFNTSLFGYQEILTDPSYAGQIISFTCPHIGNVGCNKEDNESDRVFAEGLVVRSQTKVTSNFRAEQSLDQYLQSAGVMGLCGVDTRALTTYIREHGAQMGVIAEGSAAVKELQSLAKAEGSMEGKDYVKVVSCKDSYVWDSLPWSLENGPGEKLTQEALSTRPHVVAVDCGVKRNILKLLLGSGFRVTVVPATSTAEYMLSLGPDALFLSNGPGDPATLDYVVNPVKKLLGRLPIFGICLGHQILAQAMGGKTYKLKFGHRGGNHPVMDLTTNKVEITVQNHGFAVDAKSLSKEAKITHVNLNDRTVEGLDVPGLKAFSVQYHPESSPGPHDSRYLFRRFFETVVGYAEAN